jgi:uncharacterized protein
VINNVHVPGAVMAYGKMWMMWKVKSVDDVTPDSLAYLRVVKPVPDLLIFGAGETANYPPRESLQLLRELNIGFEALSTVRAVPLLALYLRLPWSLNPERYAMFHVDEASQQSHRGRQVPCENVALPHEYSLCWFCYGSSRVCCELHRHADLIPLVLQVQAVQYFNLLNQEQRSVVCALLPDE